jgi:hypothetical protein
MEASKELEEGEIVGETMLIEQKTAGAPNSL